MSQQTPRDHSYNLKPLQVNSTFLLHNPIVKMIRAWNQNELLIKSEAEVTDLKEYFTMCKFNSYESECLKINCYICNRR